MRIRPGAGAARARRRRPPGARPRPGCASSRSVALEQVEAGDLLLGLRERPVRRDHLAVDAANGHGSRRELAAPSRRAGAAPASAIQRVDVVGPVVDSSPVGLARSPLARQPLAIAAAHVGADQHQVAALALRRRLGDHGVGHSRRRTRGPRSHRRAASGGRTPRRSPCRGPGSRSRRTRRPAPWSRRTVRPSPGPGRPPGARWWRRRSGGAAPRRARRRRPTISSTQASSSPSICGGRFSSRASSTACSSMYFMVFS